jgi:hypothetical protein
MNLTGAQAKSRDAKRVQDISSIKDALELYYSDYKHYPTEGSGWACKGSITPTSLDCDNNDNILWTTLSTELAPYLSPLPTDPQHKAVGYKYYVDMQNTTDAAKAAIIKVKLEKNPSAMANDNCPDNDTYYDVIVGNFGAELTAACEATPN